MLAVVEIVVHEGDVRLLGHSLYSVAIDYGIEPLSVIGPDGSERPCEPKYRLVEEDRLVAVAILADLDRIVRRAQIPSDWSVEVTRFPLSARATLVLRVRALHQMDSDTAESLVANAPFLIAERQSRGQAMELLASLHREKAEGRIVQANSTLPKPPPS
jgi:hypothetical protein